MSSQDKHVLVYFDVTGRAEPTRWAFQLANVPFEDKRISQAEWANMKSESPNGKVPYLICPNGKVYCESLAILQYVSAMGDLIPPKDNPEMWLQAEQVIHCIEDLAATVFSPNVFMASPEAKEKHVKENLDLVRKIWKSVDSIAKRDQIPNSKFLVGGKLTFADLYLTNFLDGMQSDWNPFCFKDIDSELPTLSKMRIAVHEHLKAKNVHITPPMDTKTEKCPKQEKKCD